jgi:hypothetical protein
MDVEHDEFPRPALERLWTPLRVAWEGQGRPEGWQLSNDAKQWKLDPELPRSTAQSWIDPWKAEPADRPGLPRSFPQFFTFVRVLGAENDLDKEPGLCDLPNSRKRWEQLYDAAKAEAREAAAAQRTRRQRTRGIPRAKGPRRRGALWWASGSLTGLLASIATIVIYDNSGGQAPPAASTTRTCAYVTDGPAGVYPSPDTRTTPLKWKNEPDRVVVLHQPAAPPGWVVVFTPRDRPGYQWMLDRQLGPEAPCRSPAPGS